MRISWNPLFEDEIVQNLMQKQLYFEWLFSIFAKQLYTLAYEI